MTASIQNKCVAVKLNSSRKGALLDEEKYPNDQRLLVSVAYNVFEVPTSRRLLFAADAHPSGRVDRNAPGESIEGRDRTYICDFGGVQIL